MNRLRAIILGAWTLGLPVLFIGRRYSLFIRAQLWPLLLASTIILALFIVAMCIRRASSHKLKLADWVRAGMLLLPLLYLGSLITGASASGLNSYAFRNKSMGFSDSMLDTGDSCTVRLDPKQAINLGYIARHQDSLNNSHVITEGCVWHDDSRPADQVVIFRFVIVCCAADAIPVQAVVESPQTLTLKNDGWIRVSGTLHLQKDSDGDMVPVIAADQIQPIASPSDPYLSPYQF